MRYLFFVLSIVMMMGCSQSETIAASNGGGKKERKMLVPGETFTIADFYISDSYLALVLKNNAEEHLSFYLDYSVKCDSSAHVSYVSSDYITLSAFETKTEWILLRSDSRKSTVCNLEMTTVRAFDSEKFNTWTGAFRITTAKF